MSSPCVNGKCKQTIEDFRCDCSINFKGQFCNESCVCINPSPPKYKVLLGTSVNLTCTTNQSTTSLEWKNEELTENNEKALRSSILTIKDASTCRNYTCSVYCSKATQKCWEKRVYSVEVYHEWECAIDITNETTLNDSIHVTPGAHISLNRTVLGQPVPYVQWFYEKITQIEQFQGNQTIIVNNITYIPLGNESLATALLEIQSAREEDSGLYQLRGSYLDVEETLCSVYINATAAPKALWQCLAALIEGIVSIVFNVIVIIICILIIRGKLRHPLVKEIPTNTGGNGNVNETANQKSIIWVKLKPMVLFITIIVVFAILFILGILFFALCPDKEDDLAAIVVAVICIVLFLVAVVLLMVVFMKRTSSCREKTMDSDNISITSKPLESGRARTLQPLSKPNAVSPDNKNPENGEVDNKKKKKKKKKKKQREESKDDDIDGDVN